MCYSAQVKADYKKYVQIFGAVMSIRDFYDTFWRRKEGGKQKILKAMEDAFADPQTDAEREIKGLIDAFKAEQATKFEQELFKQRKRLADAERALQTKTTKAATESQRIAGEKIESTMRSLANLRRTEARDSDSRIFPGTYAPVMVWEDGKRVIKPMRYQCRPAGKPAFYDVKYPGTYNARRDNLEGFWKGQFGHTHGIMIVNAFYENVNLHKAEGRELADGEAVQNLVLEMAGLMPHDGERHLRAGATPSSFSVLHYAKDRLVCVESVNAPMDHMAARKLLESGTNLSPEIASDSKTALKAHF